MRRFFDGSSVRASGATGLLLIALTAAGLSERAEAEAAPDRRVAHARELMGGRYRKSVVRTGEQIGKVRKLVREWTRESLPKRFKEQEQAITEAVLRESERRGFDPIFLLSVIQAESQFNPATVGSFGEVGLMQIKPSTARWICKKKGIRWKGKRWLKTARANIRVGAAFLSYLRDRYDSHARLYLSAYNMGQGNVDQALDRNIWPRDYAGRVMGNYVNYYRQLRARLVAQKGDEGKERTGRSLASKQAQNRQAQTDQK
ncbi:MAG: lytic transglycosylase domain-containing protein [Oligoflexia bacterium]|nr:lytic transglycosylase domain-containing protein [Oligoflexia bacterium]